MYINWGCSSTMEGISPNLLGKKDFICRVLRGHCFLVMAKVLGFYTAIFLCSFGKRLAEPSSLEAGVF